MMDLPPAPLYSLPDIPLPPMDLSRSTSPSCPIYCIIEKMSKKWSMLILRAFTHEKTMRFSEILEALPEINSRMLSERLDELEADGLIRRIVEDTKPATITYEITAKGMDLRKVFGAFIGWAKKWGARPAASRA